jgi:hypothetical protein
VLSGRGLPVIYVSGDNASLRAVAEISQNVPDIDMAVLFAGAARVPSKFRDRPLRPTSPRGITSRSCLREVIDNLAKILRRCHSTVGGLRNRPAPTSGFDRPSRPPGRSAVPAPSTRHPKTPQPLVYAQSRRWRATHAGHAPRTRPSRSRTTSRTRSPGAPAPRPAEAGDAATRRDHSGTANPIAQRQQHPLGVRDARRRPVRAPCRAGRGSMSSPFGTSWRSRRRQLRAGQGFRAVGDAVDLSGAGDDVIDVAGARLRQLALE